MIRVKCDQNLDPSPDSTIYSQCDLDACYLMLFHFSFLMCKLGVIIMPIVDL